MTILCENIGLDLLNLVHFIKYMSDNAKLLESKAGRCALNDRKISGFDY